MCVKWVMSHMKNSFVHLVCAEMWHDSEIIWAFHARSFVHFMRIPKCTNEKNAQTKCTNDFAWNAQMIPWEPHIYMTTLIYMDSVCAFDVCRDELMRVPWLMNQRDSRIRRTQHDSWIKRDALIHVPWLMNEREMKGVVSYVWWHSFIWRSHVTYMNESWHVYE